MRQCPILMYHWFRPSGVPSSSRSPQLEITPELFRRQMTLLKRVGYTPVSLERALRAPGEENRPRRPIVITFDDGALDFWHHARSALQECGFPATLFVVSGYVGGSSSWDRDLGEPDRPLLSWDQLRRLQHDGFEIGSHAHSHRPLTELADHEVRSEFDHSRRIIEAELGTAPRYLAYPRGRHTDRHKRLAREAGFAGACAVILNWRDLRCSDRYALRRMTVKGEESMLYFRLRLALSRRVRYLDGERPAGSRYAA